MEETIFAYTPEGTLRPQPDTWYAAQMYVFAEDREVPPIQPPLTVDQLRDYIDTLRLAERHAVRITNTRPAAFPDPAPGAPPMPPNEETTLTAEEIAAYDAEFETVSPSEVTVVPLTVATPPEIQTLAPADIAFSKKTAQSIPDTPFMIPGAEIDTGVHTCHRGYPIIKVVSRQAATALIGLFEADSIALPRDEDLSVFDLPFTPSQSAANIRHASLYGSSLTRSGIIAGARDLATLAETCNRLIEYANHILAANPARERPQLSEIIEALGSLLVPVGTEITIRSDRAVIQTSDIIFPTLNLRLEPMKFSLMFNGFGYSAGSTTGPRLRHPHMQRGHSFCAGTYRDDWNRAVRTRNLLVALNILVSIAGKFNTASPYIQAHSFRYMRRHSYDALRRPASSYFTAVSHIPPSLYLKCFRELSSFTMTDPPISCATPVSRGADPDWNLPLTGEGIVEVPGPTRTLPLRELIQEHSLEDVHLQMYRAHHASSARIYPPINVIIPVSFNWVDVLEMLQGQESGHKVNSETFLRYLRSRPIAHITEEEYLRLCRIISFNDPSQTRESTLTSLEILERMRDTPLVQPINRPPLPPHLSRTTPADALIRAGRARGIQLPESIRNASLSPHTRLAGLPVSEILIDDPEDPEEDNPDDPNEFGGLIEDPDDYPDEDNEWTEDGDEDDEDDEPLADDFVIDIDTTVAPTATLDGHINRPTVRPDTALTDETQPIRRPS